MRMDPLGPGLKAGLVIAVTFVLGMIAGAAADRVVRRPAPEPPLPPLTIQDMAHALALDPAQRARVGAVLDSLRPEIAAAAAQGPDSLELATRRARRRIAETLPPGRRAQFQQWLDARHNHMIQMMRRFGPERGRGMMGPGMGPAAPPGVVPGTMGGGAMGQGMMGRMMGSGRTPVGAAEPSAGTPGDTVTAAASSAAALPAPDSPGARLVAARCSLCHVSPSPALHTAGEWPAVIRLMRQRIHILGIGSLSDAEADTVLRYLQQYARH